MQFQIQSWIFTPSATPSASGPDNLMLLENGSAFQMESGPDFLVE